jgi:hypothetical protein
LIARIVALACLVTSAAAVALVVRQAISSADGGSAGAPSCRALDDEELTGRVTCTAASSVLTIAAERTPLVVEGTEARVLRSRIDGDELTVRLRLRPPGERRARPERDQVYLTVAGRRFAPGPLAGGRRPGRTATVSLRFRLPRELAGRVLRGDVRADLGIVPFEHLGADRPPRLGVVRLDPR